MRLACHGNAIHWHTHPHVCPGHKEWKRGEGGGRHLVDIHINANLCPVFSCHERGEAQVWTDSSLSPFQTRVFKLSSTKQKLSSDALRGVQELPVSSCCGGSQEVQMNMNSYSDNNTEYSLCNNNNNTFNLEAPFKTPKVTLQSI